MNSTTRHAFCSWTTSSPYRSCSAIPLEKDGYEVVPALDGQDALNEFDRQPFDLVVLDIMLPKVDGLEVCRQLRAKSSVPIIMLTAKAEEIDKVLGLELGADDYITKPFSMREFRSRVRAALRRADMSAQLDGDEEPLERGDLRIDFAKRTVALQRRAGAAHICGVRDPRRAGRTPRARLHPRHAAGPHLGRLGVPRPAHHRRAHPAPAREARAATRRSPSTC